jgi:DNA-binding GntR family transcriptional regulator
MREARSRNQDAYEALKRDIARFHYKPGERLREEALSERYNVSRTPIRDALRRLEQEGLITTEGVGRFVRQFDVREFEDIYRVRASIERVTAMQAAEVASDEAIAALRDGWERAEGDDGYDLADVRFHVGVAQLSGNAFAMSSLSQINDRIGVIRMVDFGHDERVVITRGEHEEILDAIAARDAERAGALMEAHIGAAMTNVSTLLTEALATIYLGKALGGRGT